ncbi:MAG: sensor histidine kinase [Chloroflexi bacterium]|nr:sensor histidine kinase [Chloroflexota bacterium]
MVWSITGSTLERTMSAASRLALVATILWAGAHRTASRFGELVHPHVRHRQFYVVQAMVILTAALDTYLDINPGGLAPPLGHLYFVPETLFLIPVVYAALNFGVFLAVFTGMLCIILTSPIWLFWHADEERWGVLVQVGVVLAVAFFVGMRVDREMKARRQAEAARAALELSEKRLRSYAAEMVRAQEEERQRLAQELHDETIQELVQLARQIDHVETKDRPLPLGVSDELSAARTTVQDIVGHLRNFARNLRPYVLEDLGMVPALRRLARELGERCACSATLEVIGPERRLGSDVELGIFRIAQEALRNVEHHANARRAAVTLNYRDSDLLLVVEDDGCGFAGSSSSNELSRRGKLGILGMEERTRLLGGVFTIHSTPGRGTWLSVSVPHADPLAGSRFERDRPIS